MVKFDELVVLLPCHSLEDFPTWHRGADAEGLLAAWSAAWHPALIAAAGATPTWNRADYPPDEVQGRLFIVPTVAEAELPPDFAERVAAGGGRLIRGHVHRDDLVAEAKAAVSPAGTFVESGLAADFLALGTVYLLTELLTRRMRHMSRLDEPRFRGEVVAAATASTGGDLGSAGVHLSAAFAELVQARGHFYPVDACFVDLVLVAPTTIGATLRGELAAGTPTSVLASGTVLEEMARSEPTSLTALRKSLDESTATLVGGELDELPIAFLPLETILTQLRLGLAEAARHLGRRPAIFGRRRHGLTPALPQLLTNLGFKGALHVTLDDGRFPHSERSKTRWEGCNYAAIDATARLPLDAALPETVLALAERLGDSMDYDHVAALVFAHWPGGTSPYFDDLRRAARHAPVLGRFVTLEHFFQATDTPSQFSKFLPDQYRAPYLQQAVSGGERDPISRYVRFARRSLIADAANSLSLMASLLDPSSPPIATDLLDDIERAGPLANAAREAELDSQLATWLQTGLFAFADALPRDSESTERGILHVNPYCFPRSDSPLPLGEGPGARVPLPPLGFAWIGDTASSPRPPTIRDNVLENEFCEVRVHPTSGGIQSVRDLRTHGNRLSQKIAVRLPAAELTVNQPWRDDDTQAEYSTMVADAIAPVEIDRDTLGIETHGRLVDSGGRRLAGYTQRVLLTAGSRVARLEIDLEPDEPPTADPWKSYYGCRFAWSDPAAELRRSVHLGNFATTARRVEAPHFVEVLTGSLRTAILTGGLPFHRRSDTRMLDCLLIVRGETSRSFRLGIGLDLPQTWPAALDLIAAEGIAIDSPAPAMRRGWLFHMDARNVAATRWEPRTNAGRLAGFRVRLLETEGRSASAGLGTFRRCRAARRTDFEHAACGELPIEGDRIRVELAAHEWIEIEADFEDQA